MNTVVDPFTGDTWTETQPAEVDQAPWRAILAGSIVLLSCVFTFVVLPLL